MAVVIETTIGCLTVDLFTKERPRTCTNFLKLCKMKYYNFCLFHCVQSNFIAQTGDPTGTGNGGESIFSMIHGDNAKYYEAEALPKIKHQRAGLVSMVNCGNNMLGSQFFFTLGEDLHSLDGEHCVFGEVAEGLDVLIQLNEVICDEEHHPFRDIRITHTVVLEDPFDDPPNLLFPDRSPEPTEDRLRNGRIAPDEEIDDTKGKTAEEVKEMMQKREAKARATILEIVGDIPDAEITPPENILFVCKLNPVTTDEDLEIIFGRFGDIKSCEVIRDKKSGDSLQYAFIEFTEKEACEKAYFKMDNVLIDDRRIHVDFSQSVAKMRWKGKGKGVEYFSDDKPKHSQQRPSKERDDEKRDPNERKRHASRSKSPFQSRQRNQEERNLHAWEKYQSRKERDREQYMSGYRKTRDCCDSRSRVYEDKPRGFEYYGRRSYDHNREVRDMDHYYKKEFRRYGSKEPYHYGRGHVSERQMDYMISKRRDRSHAVGRGERKYTEYDERNRRSKENSSKIDKRLDVRSFYGEYSRYNYEKGGPRNMYRQRRFRDKHTHGQRYYHDETSENEDKTDFRERRRQLEEDRIYPDSGKRSSYPSKSDIYQFCHSGKSASDDQGNYKISYKYDIDKDRVMRQGSHMDSDVSGKYESNKSMVYTSKDYHRGKTMKAFHKAPSKQGGRDTTRRSSSSEKFGKENVSKNKKIAHRRRKSSSCSSYDTIDDGSSSDSSSSSESDDSDAESDSDDTESYSTSSSSTDRKSKANKKNKKQVLETKKNKIAKSGYKKRLRSSSESSENTSEKDTKNKRKHKKRNDSSSSERKVVIHGRGLKSKKKSKKNPKKKKESSESSSEESSSSSESYIQRKSLGGKMKKRSEKGVVCKKDNAKNSKSSKNKGRKSSVLVSPKKKKKRDESISSKSSDSSDDSESGSSRVEHKHRKDQPAKEKDGSFM